MDVRAAARVLVAAALLAGLFLLLEVPEVMRRLSMADPTLYGAALVLFLSTYLPSGLRWSVLAGEAGHSTRFGDSVRVVAVSYSFNKLLPWNTGDLARSKIAERYGEVDSHARLMGALAAERSLDLAALLSVIGVASVLIAPGLSPALAAVLYPSAVLVALLAAAYMLFPARALSLLPDRLAEALEEALEGFRACSAPALGASAGLSLVKWWTEAAVFYLLVLSLGSGIGFWEGAAANSALSLVSALPISPAGLGAADAAATGILTVSGATAEEAFSAVVLWRTLGIGVQGAVGAAVYGLDI